FPPGYPCQNHSIKKTTDATLKLLRQHILPKKWIWAETGWGSPNSIAAGSGPIITVDNFHLDWASNLLSTDNLAGFLLWQAKDISAGFNGIWTSTGRQAQTYDLVKNYMTVLWDNRDFLS